MLFLIKCEDEDYLRGKDRAATCYKEDLAGILFPLACCLSLKGLKVLVFSLAFYNLNPTNAQQKKGSPPFKSAGIHLSFPLPPSYQN